VQLSGVPFVVFYPVIVVHNITLGFLQTKHLRYGEMWKLTDAVIKTYDFDRTYMFISQGPGGGKEPLPILSRPESFSLISDIHT
jgi:hypothetical protein